MSCEFYKKLNHELNFPYDLILHPKKIIYIPTLTNQERKQPKNKVDLDKFIVKTHLTSGE